MNKKVLCAIGLIPIMLSISALHGNAQTVKVENTINQRSVMNTKVNEIHSYKVDKIEIQKQNIIPVKFEVSFYTTSPDEGSGTGIGASGEYVQPWISIAMPKDIPFYSEVYIEELDKWFINHDTGSYIKWTNDDTCRVDVCVNTKEEAMKYGRFISNGYIVIK